MKETTHTVYQSQRFFDKYKALGWSLKQLAGQLGYSEVYVRKVACRMQPITDGFVGRATIRLGEDSSIFLKTPGSTDRD